MYYDPDKGIAEVGAGDGIVVGTLLQRPGVPITSIHAYAQARYSRNPSDSGMQEILAEVLGNAKDPQERLDNIVLGYGHTSVTGLGHIQCYVQGVGILESMKFFNLCPLQDGQELSTRYVDLGNTDLDSFMLILCEDGLGTEYSYILQDLMAAYNNLLPKTIAALGKAYPNTKSTTLKARALDCVRYLIPLGLRINFGAVQSGRAWSQYIKHLGGCRDTVSQRIGYGLRNLLTIGIGEYVPEAKSLIRYTEPRHGGNYSIRDLDLGDPRIDYWERGQQQMVLTEDLDPPQALINIYNLEYPYLQTLWLHPSKGSEILAAIGRAHNHQSEMPPYMREGAINIRGIADLGTIKDLQRHRGLYYVPFLSEDFNLTKELDGDPSLMFSLCPYLDNPAPYIQELAGEYREALTGHYSRVQAWYRQAQDKGLDNADIWAKRLLPQGHLTSYTLSTDVARLHYLISLRTRPGGHIQYRMTAYGYGELLTKAGDRDISYAPIKGLMETIAKPDPFSVEEFKDRS